MAFLDRCIFIPTAGGTTDWTESSAVTGYLTPTGADAIDGAPYGYAAQSADLSQWEVGKGAWDSGTTTLARTTVIFSTNSNTKVSFSSPPTVFVCPLANDFRTLLQADTTFYFSTTGSNSNPGTLAEPFATAEYAASVVGALDCQGQYTATIQGEDGTYTGVSIGLPNVVGINPIAPPVLQGNTTTPANCVLQGTGAGDQIVLNDTPGTLWRVGGFEYDMNGATAIYGQNFSATYIFASNFIGLGGTGVALKTQRNGYIDGANYPLSTTPPNPGAGFYGDPISFEFGGYMDELVFELGLCNVNFDGAPIAFISGCETSDIASFDVEGEARLGFYYTQFSNPTNLTNDTNIGCYLWDKSTIDTIPLTRNQLPGQVGQIGIFDQFQNSLCTGDQISAAYSPFSPSNAATIQLPDGCRQAILTPAAAIATLTIALPKFPGDGDSVAIGTGFAIAATTFTSTDGVSLVGTMPAGLGQGGQVSLTFVVTTWCVSGGNHG